MAAIFITQANALTLREAAEDVVQTNPIVLERQKYYKTVVQDIRKAYSGWYPTLDWHSWIGNETTDNRDLNIKDTNDFAQSHQLVLNYNLFDGFGTTSRIDEEKTRLRSAAYSYVEKANDTIFELSRVYLDMLRYKELLEVDKNSVEMHEKYYEDIKNKKESGLGTASEYDEAASKLALAYANRISAQNNLEDIKVKFIKILGRIVKPGELKEPDFKLKLPSTIEEATSMAIAYNPSLLVKKYEIEAAKYRKKYFESEYYPKIDAELKGERAIDQTALDQTVDTYGAYLHLRYNLFRGFSDQSEIQKQISTIHQELQNSRELRRETVESLQLSWTALDSLQKQKDFLETYVDASERRLKAYYEEFKLGRRTSIDLLNSVQDYNEARKKLINAKYDLLFAKYRIYDAMGMLPEALGINVRKNVELVEVEYIETPPKLEENNQTYPPEDVLPLKKDYDKDRVVDIKDNCQNSKDGKVNAYGCSDIIRIRDFDFIKIELEDQNMTTDGELTDSGELSESGELNDANELENSSELSVSTNNIDNGNRNNKDSLSQSKNIVKENTEIAKQNNDVETTKSKINANEQITNKDNFDDNIAKSINNDNSVAVANKRPTILIGGDDTLSENESKTAITPVVNGDANLYELTKLSKIRKAPWGDVVYVWSKGRKIKAVEVDNDWAKIDGYYWRDSYVPANGDWYIFKKNIDSIGNSNLSSQKNVATPNIDINNYEKESSFKLKNNSKIRDSIDGNVLSTMSKGRIIKGKPIDNDWILITRYSYDGIEYKPSKNWYIHSSNLSKIN
jgi:adhesin transport system outer membrane protein